MIKFCVSFVKKITPYIYTFFIIALLYAASRSIVFAMEPHKANLYSKLWEYAKSDETLSALQDLIEDTSNDLNINQPHPPSNATVLHIAAFYGAESAIDYLLKRNNQKRSKPNDDSHKPSLRNLEIDIDAKTISGLTALEMAIQGGHLKIAKMLLVATIQYSRGNVAYYRRVLDYTFNHISNKEFITFFIKEVKKVEPHFNNQDVLNSFLRHSILHNKKIFAEALLEVGAQISSKDELGRNILHLASEKLQNKEFIEFLIKKSKEHFNINTPNNYGDTPLMLAVFFNNKAAIESLLEARAKINIQLPLNHVTKNACTAGLNLLHIAVNHYPHHEFTTLMNLIEKKLGLAALYEAMEAYSTKELPRFNGMTPLHLAAAVGNISALEYFIKKGNPFWSRSQTGCNILDYAVVYKQLKVIEWLLKNDSFYLRLMFDPAIRYLPFQIAALERNSIALESIIKHLRPQDIKTFIEHKTPHSQEDTWTLAIKSKDFQTTKVVFDFMKNNLNSNDFSKKLYIHFAARMGNSAALEMMLAYIKEEDKKATIENKDSVTGEDIFTLALQSNDLQTINVVFNFIKNTLDSNDFYKKLYIHRAAQMGNSAALEMILKQMRTEDKKSALEHKDPATGENIWTYALKSGDLHTVKLIFRFMQEAFSGAEFNQKLLMHSISDPVLGGPGFPICFAAKKGYYPIVNFLKGFLPERPLNTTPSDIEKNSCGIEYRSIASASIILNRFPHLKYRSHFITALHPIHAAVKNDFFNWLPLFANQSTLKLLDPDQKTALKIAYDNWQTKAERWVTGVENIGLETFFTKSNILIYLMLESFPVFVNNITLRSEYLNSINHFESRVRSIESAEGQRRSLHVKYILKLLKIIPDTAASYPANEELDEVDYKKLADRIITLFNEEQQNLSNNPADAHSLQIKKDHQEQIAYVFFHSNMLNAFKELKNSVKNCAEIENSIRLAYAKTIINDWLMQIPQAASNYIFSNSNDLEKTVVSALSNSKESMDAFNLALKHKIEGKEVFYYLGILNDYIKTIYLNHQPWQSAMTKKIKKYLNKKIQNPRIISLVRSAGWRLPNEKQNEDSQEAQKLNFGFYSSQVHSVKFILDFYEDLQKVINTKGQLHPFQSIQTKKKEIKKLIDILPYSSSLADF